LMVWPGGTNFLWTMPWMLEKKWSTWTWHCCKLDTLFFRPQWIWRLTLRRLLLSLRVVTIHPCFITSWKWSWGRLWLVVWVPCRQKREGTSGRCSAVLAQISQKCVSCSNCPPKCIEWSCMTVLLSHKHHG